MLLLQNIQNVFINSFALRAHDEADSYRLRWWIAAAVMLVTILEVLDMTIITVSLPQMMGSLQANVDQISWVLTSYTISTAVMMPLTGFLVDRLGTRRLLLINILGFMVSSVLCGLATNLSCMILFRIAQGLFGAASIPMSQSILFRVFPKAQQGLAIAIWSAGLLCAPIFGPVLGGYITGHLSWRWVFYLNLPVCLLAFGLSCRVIRETMIEKRPWDWLGFTLLCLGVGALQIVLDRGNIENWFDSTTIIWLAITAGVALFALIFRCLTATQPIIHLHLFSNRNFTLYTLLMLAFSLVLFGQVFQSPLMLQTVFGYSTVDSGLLMLPRSLGNLLVLALTAPFIRHLNTHGLLYAGLSLTILGTFLLSRLSLVFSIDYYLWTSALQGIGMGLFFLPIGLYTVDSLDKKDIAEGSGLSGFGRSLGMSLGISLMTTIFTHNSQVQWHALASHVDVFNLNVQLAGLHAQQAGFTTSQFFAKIATNLQLQAGVLAFNHVAVCSTLGMLALYPLIYCLKKAPALARQHKLT